MDVTATFVGSAFPYRRQNSNEVSGRNSYFCGLECTPLSQRIRISSVKATMSILNAPPLYSFSDDYLVAVPNKEKSQ